MFFLRPGAFTPEGELRERLLKNAERLSAPEYTYPAAFNDGNGWPGDWPGRAILGQLLVSDALQMPLPALEENLLHLEELFNERGYAGPVFENVNEQQLSGNSWLLRALCELYERRRSPEILQRIERMTEGLYEPLKGLYPVYPRTKESRMLGTGAASGTNTGEIINGWELSSDIGCCFIPLDGMSHAYRITKRPALKAVLEEAVEAFLSSDLIAATFQTHATLSACRGILRFAEDTGRDDLIGEVEKIFRLYQTDGMTENYANQNWFRRPEWTEPCAIVDSFMVAMQLRALTGRRYYLETASLIWYNGLAASQRQNGGFGCDCCAGETLSVRIYEASWCCSMRGGEGLSAATACAAEQREKLLRIHLLFPGVYRSDRLEVRLETGFPLEGNVKVTVLRAEEGAELEIAAPYPFGSERLIPKDGFARVNGTVATGDVFEFELLLPTGPVPALFERGMTTLRRGPVLYGTSADTDSVSFPLGLTEEGDLLDSEDRLFRPLFRRWEQPEGELTGENLRVLFQKQPASLPKF